ncbi:MAG: CocE/NonD family hydrolase [Euryarchaeota archaeon]|nr:CocE/NonD family hydrolase [Euryarchaeota archaeon]
MRGRAFLLTLIFVGSVLAGCFTDDSDVQTPDVDETFVPTDPVVAYLHDVSVPNERITVVDSIVEQVKTEIGGVLLDTWLVRPDTTEKVPIVIQVTPYYGGGDPVRPTGQQGFGRLADILVASGYAYAVSSVRGTGNSEGCFTQGGPQEAKDTAAVIEQLAASAWSNGNVGLIGVSYPGTTPQDVWIEAPPSLKTIVPISGISDFYKYNFVNGVHINIQGFGFNTYYVPYTAFPDPFGLTDPLSVPGSVTGEACTDQVEVQEGGVSSTLDGNKDAYWQVRDFSAELSASWDKNQERASVFYIHGLQDWNVKPHMMEDWLPLLQDTGVPFKAWLGQWSHNWPQREDWWNTTMLAWFDQFLKEKETGILDAPAIQVQRDDGVWRHEAVWPPTDVEWRSYHPNVDGWLNTTVGTGTVTYHDARGGLQRLATDMAPHEARYRSAPLTEDLTIAGLPRLVANVTTDGERASVIVSLGAEAHGKVRWFNFAAQSLNHVADLASGESDVSGKTIPVDVRFFPQDDIVHKGERLIIAFSGNTMNGSPGPSLQPVSTGARITVDLASTTLHLPVDTSVVVEDPQPCWEANAEARDCYHIR